MRGSSAGASHMVKALLKAVIFGVAVWAGSGLYSFCIKPSTLGTGAIWAHHSANRIHTFVEIPWSGCINIILQHLKTWLTCSSQGCARPSSAPWFLVAIPESYQHLLIPIFAILLSKSQRQTISSAYTPIMTTLSCIAYVLYRAIHHAIVIHDVFPAAITSFVAALAFGMTYTAVINWTRRQGNNYTAAIPGITILGMLGIAESGDIRQRFGLGLAVNMLFVGILITFGLFLGESIAWTSAEEDIFIDLVKDIDVQGTLAPSVVDEQETFSGQVMKGDDTYRWGG